MFVKSNDHIPFIECTNWSSNACTVVFPAWPYWLVLIVVTNTDGNEIGPPTEWLPYAINIFARHAMSISTKKFAKLTSCSSFICVNVATESLVIRNSAPWGRLDLIQNQDFEWSWSIFNFEAKQIWNVNRWRWIQISWSPNEIRAE